MAEQSTNKKPKKFRRKHTWWKYCLIFFGGFLFAFVFTLVGSAVASATVPANTIVQLLPEDMRGILSFIDQGDTFYTVTMKFVTGELTIDDVLDGIEIKDLLSTDLLGEKIHVKMCYYKTEYNNPQPSPEPEPEPQGLLPLLEEEPEPQPEPSPEPDPAVWTPITLNMVIKSEIPGPDGTKRNLMDNLMGNLVIADVMDTAGTPLDALKDTPIDKVAETLPNTKIGDLFPNAEQGSMIYAVKEKTLNDLQGEQGLNDVKVGDLLNVTEESDHLTKAMCYRKDEHGNIDFNNPRTVGDFKDMQTVLDELLIDDIIEINEESDAILKAIKGTSVGNLSTRISALTVSDVFPNTSDSRIIEWLKDPEGGGNPLVSKIDNVIDTAPLSAAIDIDNMEEGVAKNIFAQLANVSLKNLGNEFNSVKIVDALANEIYDNPTEKTGMKGAWKMVLYKDISKPDSQQDYLTYTMNSFGNLMTNMNNNLNNGTIQNFFDCGLLDNVEQTTLDKEYYGTKIGDMKLVDLINIIAGLPA